MKKKHVTCLLASTIILSGCSMVNSSINYTKGTQCLERGDFMGAKGYLEESVRQCPDLARNYTNLACAYTNLGEQEKAWICIRQAVLIGNDPTAFVAFKLYWEGIINNGAIKIGDSIEEVEAKLGIPDMAMRGRSATNSKQPETLIYGIIVLHFENSRLVEIVES